MQLVQGTKVLVNSKGDGNWVSGTIKRRQLDNKYEIEYDSGATESDVPPELVKADGSNHSPSSKGLGKLSPSSKGLAKFDDVSPGRQKASLLAITYEENMAIEVKSDGVWLPGKIKRLQLDNTYEVEYADGKIEEGVVGTLIRPLPSSKKPKQAAKLQAISFTIGMKIEANKGQLEVWQPAVIKSDTSGHYEVEYEDGAIEKNLPSR